MVFPSQQPSLPLTPEGRVLDASNATLDLCNQLLFLRVGAEGLMLQHSLQMERTLIDGALSKEAKDLASSVRQQEILEIEEQAYRELGVNAGDLTYDQHRAISEGIRLGYAFQNDIPPDVYIIEADNEIGECTAESMGTIGGFVLRDYFEWRLNRLRLTRDVGPNAEATLLIQQLAPNQAPTTSLSVHTPLTTTPEGYADMQAEALTSELGLRDPLQREQFLDEIVVGLNRAQEYLRATIAKEG